MVNAPENLKDLQRDLKVALGVMEERREDYVKGREFYEGDRDEVFASKYVRKLVAKNAEAMPVSFAHIPVDVIVDMIELTSLEVKDASASALLTTVTENNNIEDESEDWLRKAAYFGDYYAIVEPSAEDAETGDIEVESLRWLGSSPLTTVRIYDKADETTPLFGAKVWQDGKVWKGRLFYDDSTVRLISQKGATLAAKIFELDFEEDEEDAWVTHPGGRMLIEHLPIDGKPYGTPLHKKAWGPQDAITKISATNLANLEGIGLPARWAILDPKAQIDDDIDADFGTDGPGVSADNADGLTTATRGSKVRSVPGGIAYLAGISQVGTFESGDGNIFLANQDWYVRAMAVATGIPLFEFDLTGDQPSGESRRRAMTRSLRKAKRVRRASGHFLESLAETTLAVLGKEKQKVTATFYPIETSTDKEGIELVAAKIMVGVPIRTALLEAGYTDKAVEKWFPEGEPRLTPGELKEIAGALASLATAATLGVITQPQIVEALPWLFAEGAAEVLADVPSVDDDETLEPLGPSASDTRVSDAQAAKAQGDALGALVRAGANAEEAARYLGINGVTFPNVPTTVRVPESDATTLEEQ